MISLEVFQELVDLLDSSYDECVKLSKQIEQVFGNDTTCMYFKPFDLIANTISRILVSEGESEEGAEWFIYEGLPQIKKGGTAIGNHDIKSVEDYYNYLKEVLND